MNIQEVKRKDDEAKAKMKVHADAQSKAKRLGLMLVIWCWYVKENRTNFPRVLIHYLSV